MRRGSEGGTGAGPASELVATVKGGRTLRLCLAKSASPEQIDEAALLAHTEWPRGAGGKLGRARWICGGPGDSYILLDAATDAVVGHCRLRTAAESSSDETAGKNGIMTSAVIRPDSRRQRCGSAMMLLLHERARAEGYCYLYLTPAGAAGTTDPAHQMDFFTGNGYVKAPAATATNVACTKGLQTKQLAGLERLLASRLTIAAPDPEAGPLPSTAGETNEAAETCADGDQSIVPTGLRIQLIEELPLQLVMPAQLEEQMLAHLRLPRPQDQDDAITSSWVAKVPLGRPLSLARQVGPSCGLVVLRMAAASLLESPLSAEAKCCAAGASPNATACSLLRRAVQAGYSGEGEIFDIQHLQHLAEADCGLHATVMRFAGDQNTDCLGPQGLIDVLCNGALVALPYDRDQAAGGAPCCKNGHSAHYALIVGMVTKDRGGPAADVQEESQQGLSHQRLGQQQKVQSDDRCCMFAAVHGMAAGPVCSSFASWAQSNAQLCAARPDLVAAGHWKFPPGGIPNLAGQCLVLRPPDT